MAFWLLHALIPFLVWLYMIGGPIYPLNLTLVISPALLAFLMGALVWLGYWVTAMLTLASSVLFIIAVLVWIPNALDSVRERREERRLDNSTDITSEFEK